MKTILKLCLLSAVAFSTSAYSRSINLVDVLVNVEKYGQELDTNNDSHSSTYLLSGKAGLKPCAIIIEVYNSNYTINSFETLYTFETKISHPSMGRNPLKLDVLMQNMSEDYKELSFRSRLGNNVFVDNSIILQDKILSIDQDIFDVDNGFTKSTSVCEVDLRKSK